MSLFIASLAFEQSQVNRFYDERIGILAGSVISALCGYVLLRYILPAAEARTTSGETD